jgi:hypothetical protein
LGNLSLQVTYLLMSFLYLPGSLLEQIFLGLLMLPEGMFKGFHFMVYFQSELIKVIVL